MICLMRCLCVRLGVGRPMILEAVFVMCGKWLNLLLLGDSNMVKALMEQQGIIGCVLSQSSNNWNLRITKSMLAACVGTDQCCVYCLAI